MFRIDFSRISRGSPISCVSFDRANVLNQNTLSGSDRIVEVKIDGSRPEHSCELTAYYTWSDADGGRNIVFANEMEIDIRFRSDPCTNHYFLEVMATKGMPECVGFEEDPTRAFIFVVNTESRAYELLFRSDDALFKAARRGYEVRGEMLTFSDQELNAEGRDMFLNR